MRFIEYFDKGAARFPDRVAAQDDEISLTYAAMKALTHRIADALIAEGLPRGSAIATYAPNHPLGLACQYGVIRAGLVWLPVNTRNSVHDNIAILRQLDADFIFYHSAHAGEIAQIRDALPGVRGYVCIDRAADDAPSLAEWTAGREAGGDHPLTADTDVISMPTTSGTTGQPKGVLLTNAVWESMTANFQIVMPYDTPPVSIVAAPLTHAAGYLAGTMMSLGCTNIIVSRPDPLLLMEAIQRHKATTLFLPPTVIYMMLAHPRVREFDYSSLRYLLYGGAPMSVQKLREANEVFGPVMLQVYGQTEAPMAATLLLPRDHVEALENPALARRLWSAGRPGPLVQVAIMDDDGRLLGPGERGEVVCRGGIVMAGYHKNPEATEAASAHGWHHTGDIGETDEDGFVYIVDRKKDMIISGGFNVYPSEVEQVIWTHPAVQDCAVVGAPDEKWGEAVTAVVEVKPGMALDPADLVALCKERLGSVKAPKRVELWESLPRSAVGKVLKRNIRQTFWKGHARAI